MRRPVCAPWCLRQRFLAVLLLAAWACALVPGAGQYNGQHKKGVPQLGAALEATER